MFSLLRKIRVIRRINRILIVLLEAGLSSFVYRHGFKRHIHWSRRFATSDSASDSKDLPRKFRKALEKLGPVFVKFGQILSTRWDLLPREYTDELGKLQARVPTFSQDEAVETIRRNLGKPIGELFAEFETKPFASASLGQVYKAKLKSGEIVAVKVQRPGAKERVELDTKVLEVLVRLVEKYVPASRDYRLPEVVQEFRRWTLNEVDYRKEATNCEIFSKFFEKDPHVYGPKVYWEYSGDSVLTLEYVAGVSLQDILSGKTKKKINKKLVARYIGNSFVKQFFEYGYFHADPHPGNIFVIKNDNLMFLDFGMVGFLDQRLTSMASSMVLALLQKDIETLVQFAVELEESYGEAGTAGNNGRSKVNALRKELNVLVLQRTSTNVAGQYSQLMFELLNAFVRNGFSAPVDLVMLSKSILTLDNVMTQLDPDLNLEEWERPMMEKIVKDRFGPKKVQERMQNTAFVFDDLLRTLPQSTAKIIENLEKGHAGRDTISAEQLLEYERLLNARTKARSYGAILAGLLIVAAVLYRLPDQPRIFGIDLATVSLYGAFVFVLLYLFTNLKKGE